MIYNKKFGTRPILCHACGELCYNPLWEVIQLVVPPSQSRPNWLTVVTFNNGVSHFGKEAGVFERSLEMAGVSCVVLGGGLYKWKNSHKISLLHDFLSTVESEMVLVADSSDVVLVGRLSDLPRWTEEGALFNAERLMWPKNTDENQIDFERRVGGSEFPFLNAGLWIATTRFAQRLVAHCYHLPLVTESEQAYYKIAYRSFYPMMRVDAQCQVFQNLNRVGSEMVCPIRMFI